MVFNTATVGSAVTPAVIQTFISHYLNRKTHAQKPTAHISYDEGLHLIRKFLVYASHHTVEDIQRFTAQWVPHPRWVKVDEVKIDEQYVQKSAETIQAELGHHGTTKVGGSTWWQWRRPGSDLKAEWIEMRDDYNERKKAGGESKRVMLYVHGGGYFFGSVDEHRYQMQRHARKLKARVLAPRYRLAPQFPFPCGLHDCLSAYLWLLTVQDPTTIILAGDSAGGGMVLSMLVILRNQGLPLPAGAILISPWADLTHSFPSVAGDNPLDYIPAHGFHQKPSPSWPPPNTDDMLRVEEEIVKKLAHTEHTLSPQQNSDLRNDTAATGTATNDGMGHDANTVPGPGHDLSILIDGNLVEIKDQIQMYATNQLISHPLVSPILQPSLGGLPPLLIMVGGGEMLRDEQIYLAHKAANPAKYPPGDAFLDEHPREKHREQITKWEPTDVQLQVWDDLCHVAPTLSFTRPAKYMYRSIAQFGAWTLARAQKTDIEITYDDDVSIISSSDTDDEGGPTAKETEAGIKVKTANRDGEVGKAGDPLPHFKRHMIRQRVDRHGRTYELEPESELPACNLSPGDIGVIKAGPVKKWMAAKREWDTKFASAKRRVQKQRAKDMAEGYRQFGDGEVPPPSALAGRRKTGENLKEAKKTKSMGMSMWALWGSKHDEKAMSNEKAAESPETVVVSPKTGTSAQIAEEKADASMKVPRPSASRSRSRRRTVTDEHQTEQYDVDENTSAADLLALRTKHAEAQSQGSSTGTPAILVHSPTNEGDDFDRRRPKAGGIALPFSLGNHDASASMTTLTSTAGVRPASDTRTVGAMESGVDDNAFAEIDGLVKDSNVNDHGVMGRPKDLAAQAEADKNSAAEALVVENGEVVNAERPPLETFQTAMEVLPTIK